MRQKEAEEGLDTRSTFQNLQMQSGRSQDQPASGSKNLFDFIDVELRS